MSSEEVFWFCEVAFTGKRIEKVGFLCYNYNVYNYIGGCVMNCPYCSKEMRLGYFHNAERPIQWIPDGKKSTILNFAVAEGAVAFGEKYSLIKGYVAQAYYCEECNIVIAKTKE